jgi:hypothetical protein
VGEVGFGVKGRSEGRLGGQQREGQLAGLGSRVHDFEDTPVVWTWHSAGLDAGSSESPSKKKCKGVRMSRS